MKEIPLSQGLFAKVDEADFEWLSQWKWSAGRYGSRFYAVRTVQLNGKKHTVFMHVALLSGMPTVDHHDGDGLNNQRENLRAATKGQQRFNSSKQRRNTSGYRGVSFDKTRGKWMANFCVNGKLGTIGRFETAIEAAEAWDRRASEAYGEFAKLNFP